MRMKSVDKEKEDCAPVLNIFDILQTNHFMDAIDVTNNNDDSC